MDWIPGQKTSPTSRQRINLRKGNNAHNFVLICDNEHYLGNNTKLEWYLVTCTVTINLVTCTVTINLVTYTVTINLVTCTVTINLVTCTVTINLVTCTVTINLVTCTVTINFRGWFLFGLLKNKGRKLPLKCSNIPVNVQFRRLSLS